MTDLPLGIYEQLVTSDLNHRLRQVDPALVDRDALDPADGHEALARHIARLVRRVLRATGGDGPDALARQVDLTNQITRAIAELAPESVGADDLVADSRDLLLALAALGPTPAPVQFPPRPEVPLTASALLVNGRGQPRIGTEVQRELASADNVDLLCAFVRWAGVRVLDSQLEDLTRRGGRLRVLTTTYIGATERKALDRLVRLGAQVKVSYETHTTRLHAKAWLFHRRTGFTTGYVGSSNLSRSALLDGLEWNVRLAADEQGHLLDTFRATFDEYWEDPTFEPYDPEDARQRERLDQALAVEGRGPSELPLELATLAVRPFGYQQEILEELQAERDIHGRWRNLVVMATGTGKTVVAGLDYRSLHEAGLADSLLFVAHREEILGQSLATFRHIMRDGSFGERLVGRERPVSWRHVFASVQSLARLDLQDQLDPAHFDMVVVDEFHHASEETKTYARLLRHVRPRVLLGLTATPERADGLDVRTWFDGRTAVELRLWEALERGLLSPFQYFGVHDATDLQHISWRRGRGYDAAELTNVYTGHDARTRIVLQVLADKVTDLRKIRGLGFCVSIEHAEFMARRFNEAGITARAVTSRTDQEARRAALRELRDGQVNVLFTVDLFNEGVDVPAIDTVLFLRPTDSATVFLQQLGRGLRLADNKPCLTVFDFIGNQHAEFRFDLRYRALTGISRRGLERELERGFPTLPAGCHIELDRVTTELVLRNVRSSLRIDWPGLVAELRRVGDRPLGEFLDETGLDLDDIYRRRRGGWAGLRRQAGLEQGPSTADDDRLAAAIGRMLHLDDQERLGLLRRVLGQPHPPALQLASRRERRLLSMLHFSLWGASSSLDQMPDGFRRLWDNPGRLQELSEVADLLHRRIHRVTHPLDAEASVPLQIHARYSRDEALAAFGVGNPASVRQGIKWVEEERADVFFVTLRKTERHYSPTTMYQDRAISASLFQWESQSTTSTASPTGQRYLRHRALGTTVHLFIRESKESDGDLGAPPYLYAGPATYLRHSNDRPIQILWKLDVDLPADIFHAARVAV
jgi:superfamily II DNA or RNA helicase/HKD family nuclease